MKSYGGNAAAWGRLLSVAGAAAILTGCSPVVVRAGSPGPPTPSSAPQGTYRLLQEPEAGYAAVLGVIGQAHRTLRMTMYELADPAAIDALIDAHRRGVATRIILDAAIPRPPHQRSRLRPTHSCRCRRTVGTRSDHLPPKDADRRRHPNRYRHSQSRRQALPVKPRRLGAGQRPRRHRRHHHHLRCRLLRGQDRPPGTRPGQPPPDLVTRRAGSFPPSAQHRR
ncbi:hypothetical protein BJP78_25495 (plasmid) [Mycobacterium avium subsp. hominissuis]|nr:hypothetical protein BEP52_24785 [Mycobacterium avium subsp. hominissuis]QWY63758.1 hypothetical protein BJP74_24620 [Mycobacterium avium subsp. hominissuis]QWY65016.1 hypothetical protein BJP78_25495 [Mycobacterium avium subsp. hominissuis]